MNKIQNIKQKLFKILCFVFLLAPFAAEAALNYSRNPAGGVVNKSLVIDISAKSVEELGIGANKYWGIYIGSWPDNSIGVFSQCVPATTLSNTFIFNLPEREYSEVDLMADMTPSSCANNNADVAYNIEGDGGGAIFRVGKEAKHPMSDIAGSAVSAATSTPAAPDGQHLMLTTEKEEMIKKIKIEILKLQIKILELQIQALLKQ